MTAAPLIEAREAGRSFRLHGQDVPALAPVSLSVAEGEVVVVTGPSGAGKSTLVSLLAGWDRPSTGEVVRTPGVTTVFVPQRIPLFDTLTVAQNIALGGSASARADGVATALGLDPLLPRFPDEVSLGERQRVGIARAVHAQVRVLILDEPTAHQDAEGTERVLALTSRPPSGCAVVYASHDPAVLAVATRVLRLEAARQLA